MKTNCINRGLQGLALTVLGLALSSGVRADQQMSTRLSMPVQVNGTINASGCNNSPGPQVTLEGEIALGGFHLQLIFQNNVKGTHTATVTYSTNVVLIELGDTITIPKQPVLGGVGGNPHILIQFHDGAGKNLTGEIYLGRCVQGLSISPEFISQVIAAAEVGALDCQNHPGPVITVGGSLTFASGLHARFIFRNNLRGTHTAQVTRDVKIIGSGTVLTIPKQPVQGGAGGNPLISAQFLDGEGNPVGKKIFLGRCNQL